MNIEKISTLVGVGIALSASVGGYYVMEERQNNLIAAVAELSKEMREVRESSDLLQRVGILETKVELAEAYDDAWIRSLADNNMNKIIVLEERMRKLKDIEMVATKNRSVIDNEIRPAIDDLFDDIDRFTGR
jgi:hypothetical protein